MLNKVLFIVSKYYAFLRFKLRRKEASLLFEGKSYCIPNPNGVGILMNTWTFSQSISNILSKLDLYVDVGAHFGDNILCVKHINPDVAILAFEPSPLSLIYLMKNIHGYSNVDLHEVALGSVEAYQEIHLDTQHLDTASLNEHSTYLKLNSKKPIERNMIQVKPLDYFTKYLFDKTNVYLKIDVETYEEEVLKGGVSFVEHVNYLEIEWTQDEQKPISKLLGYLKSPYRVVYCNIQNNEHAKDIQLINMLIEFL